MLLRPTHSSILSLTGAGSWTYYLTSLVGHGWIDLLLKIGDSLIESYVKGRKRIEGFRRSERLGGGGGGGTRAAARPLPIPPQEIMRDLPPNPSQVPMRDSFVPTSTFKSKQSRSEKEEDGINTSDEGDTSSIEDLGVEGDGEGSKGEESLYGTGSFVTV